MIKEILKLIQEIKREKTSLLYYPIHEDVGREDEIIILEEVGNDRE